ncbi:MAG: D-Ala-D-Ala carboxypeptidase family metallohydrolase [Cyanobacteria bacterium P01_D01_bin.73]
MPLLRVKQSTIFKISEAQSFMLAPSEKHNVKTGEFWATEVVEDGNHYRVRLQEELGGRSQWFVFKGHAEVVHQDPPESLYPPAEEEMGTRSLDGGGDDGDKDLTIVVIKDTVFKAKPADSSTLPDTEKISVAKGEYKIKDIEDADSHVKVNLEEALDDRIEWYVFKGHLDLVNIPTYGPPQDEPEPVVEPKVEVLRNTIFKTRTVQSSDLAENEKVIVSPGTFLITGAKPENRHYLLTLVDNLEDRKEWYGFEEHLKFYDADEILEKGKAAAAKEAPKEEPKPVPAARPRGRMINIPGYGQVGTNDLIIPGGHFTWAEATKGGSRIPVNANISRSIVKMAQRMEEVRSKVGNRSISVTSWYRPPAVNRAVGGASRSTHLSGHGVDFNVSGLSPRSVQRILDPWWNGGLGYGRTFTHIDNRGYRARWNY